PYSWPRLYHQGKTHTNIENLLCTNMVRLRQIQLDNRSTNITQELSRIFKAFSDFRLVAQIREEIERVKPCLAVSA
ncbi:MAG: hypothetical protein UT72_C0032G0009, partial [Candidatus Woesebacteria bacterium GW2011_GWB1_40_101]